MRAFPALLNQLKRTRGLSTRALAMAVGASKSTAAGVLAGTRPPPRAAVKSWGEALGLVGAELERWELLGALSHCPELVEVRLLALEQQMDLLRARIDELAAGGRRRSDAGLRTRRGGGSKRR